MRRAAAAGSQLAVAFVERGTCHVLGRLLDVTAGTALGSVVTVHDCARSNVTSAVAGMAARPGGYSVLFVDYSSGPLYEYQVQDTDAALNPVGAARLVDRRDTY